MDGSTGSAPWQVDQEFVQRLARRLLNDAHEAEDLTQEVWLTWLHRPPPPGSAPRRWMAAVIRNLAVDRHRKHGRRSRAERGSTLPEPPAVPPALVAREALRQALAEAVAGLKEPYRETVRLRFYEDLESEQIAHRLGVPLETVRTRLKRALAQLSAELERGSRGDRRTWLEGLVCLAGRPAESAGTRRPRLTRLARVTGATLLVLAATVLVWRGREGAQLARAAEDARLADGSMKPALVPGSLARAPVPGAHATEAAGAAETPEGASSLTGRVVDGFDAPVSGATIGVWLEAPPERVGSGLTTRARETVSDAAGLFRLAALPERFFLYAEARDLIGQEVLLAELDGPCAREGLVLRLGPPRTLAGTVLDEDGQALEGAEIELQGGSANPTSKRWSGVDGITCVEQLGGRALSAGDGSFRLTGLTDAVSMLHVTRPGFVGAQRLVGSGDQDIELRLERGVLLSVRVVDENGAPVGGALVAALADRIEQSSGTTGATGRIELGRFHAPGFVCLRIKAPGRAPLVRGWLAFGEGEGALEIELPRTRSLTARVLDEAGRPVPGAELALFGSFPDTDGVPDVVRRSGARLLARLTEATSDADGRATFLAALPDEALRLELVDAESRTAVQDFDVAPGIEELELRLDARGARSLSGVLRDGKTGHALGRDALATVWLCEEGGSWRSLVARADENGAYRMLVPVGGRWNGCVLANGYAPLCFSPREELGVAADLVLYPARDARLLLTDRNGVPLRGGCVLVADETGEPLPVLTQDKKWSSEMRIGTDGQVLLSGLPDAPIVLTCCPEGARAPVRRRFEPGELSAAPLSFAHDVLELDAPRVPVVFEVLDAGRDKATVAFVGTGRLEVRDEEKRVTHELDFAARAEDCFLEQGRRVRELRLDARGFPARIRDWNKNDDDWGPRIRLPGFGGRRALFPLELAPGSYEVRLVRANEPDLRIPFTVPTSRSPFTVPIVVGAR